MIIQPRRGFLTSILALSMAPAIVRASSLMAIKPIDQARPFEAELRELRRYGGPGTWVGGRDALGRWAEEFIANGETGKLAFVSIESARFIFDTAPLSSPRL